MRHKRGQDTLSYLATSATTAARKGCEISSWLQVNKGLGGSEPLMGFPGRVENRVKGQGEANVVNVNTVCAIC